MVPTIGVIFYSDLEFPTHFTRTHVLGNNFIPIYSLVYLIFFYSKKIQIKFLRQISSWYHILPWFPSIHTSFPEFSSVGPKIWLIKRSTMQPVMGPGSALRRLLQIRCKWWKRSENVPKVWTLELDHISGRFLASWAPVLTQYYHMNVLNTFCASTATCGTLLTAHNSPGCQGVIFSMACMFRVGG